MHICSILTFPNMVKLFQYHLIPLFSFHFGGEVIMDTSCCWTCHFLIGDLFLKKNKKQNAYMTIFHILLMEFHMKMKVDNLLMNIVNDLLIQVG